MLPTDPCQQLLKHQTEQPESLGLFRSQYLLDVWDLLLIKCLKDWAEKSENLKFWDSIWELQCEILASEFSAGLVSEAQNII